MDRDTEEGVGFDGVSKEPCGPARFLKNCVNPLIPGLFRCNSDVDPLSNLVLRWPKGGDCDLARGAEDGLEL